MNLTPIELTAAAAAMWKEDGWKDDFFKAESVDQDPYLRMALAGYEAIERIRRDAEKRSKSLEESFPRGRRVRMIKAPPYETSLVRVGMYGTVKGHDDGCVFIQFDSGNPWYIHPGGTHGEIELL
jgi:hypothetical protein